jgi:putative transcriptional regulator
VKNRVRELRAARGLTQQELGAALGISRQAVIAIENEKFDPSLPVALKIASIFGEPVESIFTLESQAH